MGGEWSLHDHHAAHLALENATNILQRKRREKMGRLRGNGQAIQCASHACDGRNERPINGDRTDSEVHFVSGKSEQENANFGVLHCIHLLRRSQRGLDLPACESPGSWFDPRKRVVQYCNADEKWKEVGKNIEHEEDDGNHCDGACLFVKNNKLQLYWEAK